MPTPQPPVDPDVKLPPSVVKAAAAADAIHKQAYSNPGNPQPDPTPAPAPDNQPAPAPVPQPETPPPAQSADPPAPPQPQPLSDAALDPKDKSANWTPEQLRHAYLSMKGRYEQATQSIGAMQEQLSELGDELMRTQRAQQAPRQQAPAPQPVQPLLTEEEIQTYSPELIEVMKKAARDAVMGDLQQVHNSVQRVGQQVQRVSTQGVYGDLDDAIPEWRTINVSPRFKAWCGLRDVYSGAVRGSLLKAAFQAADAPRVIAFFKGFLAEEQATGQLPDPSNQPPVPPAPRQPAVPLETLTAPGRAHPAGGQNAPTPDDKPIYSRQQIAAFYTAVRQGHYNGREQEKAATEQSIFAAQREGRVR